MTLLQWFNLCEAVLWALIAVAVLGYRVRATGKPRARCLVLAATFVCFSGTDVIEMQTGSWTEPASLLVANVLCVGMLILCLWRLCIASKKQPETR